MSLGGQSILEYVLLIGIVTIAFLLLGTDLKRSVQSMVKVTADQMGNQADADQDFSEQTQRGIMVNSASQTWQRFEKSTRERVGVTTPQEGLFTELTTNTITNASSPNNSN